jgi:predicted peptidase
MSWKGLVIVMAGLTAGLDGAPELEAKVWKDADGGEVRYRWHEPEKKEGGARFPLVLFLHGAGERGEDNRAQLKHGVADILRWSEKNDQPCFLLAPQCPAEVWWAPLDRETMNLMPGAKPAAPLQRVMKLVEEVMKQQPVEPDRFYVTGLSMGGYGTWSMLATVPEKIAAAVPVCGGGDPETAARFATVPVWAFHGGKDGVVPLAASERMVAAMKKAGREAKLTVYPEVGHDSWTATYRDGKMLEWMFGRRRGERE